MAEPREEEAQEENVLDGTGDRRGDVDDGRRNVARAYVVPTFSFWTLDEWYQAREGLKLRLEVAEQYAGHDPDWAPRIRKQLVECRAIIEHLQRKEKSQRKRTPKKHKETKQ